MIVLEMLGAGHPGHLLAVNTAGSFEMKCLIENINNGPDKIVPKLYHGFSQLEIRINVHHYHWHKAAKSSPPPHPPAP